MRNLTEIVENPSQLGRWKPSELHSCPKKTRYVLRKILQLTSYSFLMGLEPDFQLVSWGGPRFCWEELSYGPTAPTQKRPLETVKQFKHWCTSNWKTRSSKEWWNQWWTKIHVYQHLPYRERAHIGKRKIIILIIFKKCGDRMALCSKGRFSSNRLNSLVSERLHYLRVKHQWLTWNANCEMPKLANQIL